jgi:hypothetical protein
MAELRKVDPQYTLRPLKAAHRRPEPQVCTLSRFSIHANHV